MPALCVIPSFMRSDEEVEVTCTTVATLREHEPDVPVLVVDDFSPYRVGVDQLQAVCETFDVELYPCDDNEGFSATVNVGLERARDIGQDAILINADIEFIMPFVEAMTATRDSSGEPAAVVGALLLYQNGLVQHGGIYCSFFNRSFDHKFRYAPGGLPEAHVPTVCPVTGALQFIRYQTLETVGLFDESYKMGFEDVDYCLRTFEAGLECVYQPAVRAIHHESLFRGQRNERLDEWQQRSLELLHNKHGKTPLGRYVMPIT